MDDPIKLDPVPAVKQLFDLFHKFGPENQQILSSIIAEVAISSFNRMTPQQQEEYAKSFDEVMAKRGYPLKGKA